MPNIKSQKDRVIQSQKENLHNKAVKSNLKTVVKKADAAIAAGSDNTEAVKTAVSTIDKAVKKGVLHKNTAARKISKLMKRANAAE
ncbi:MAG: 30S ribosomal protein S20 [Oscillospiraceae bacterium]|nr:30S ribosomal protein S20 [Oscillospiraceae bacterium]